MSNALGNILLNAPDVLIHNNLAISTDVASGRSLLIQSVEVTAGTTLLSIPPRLLIHPNNLPSTSSAPVSSEDQPEHDAFLTPREHACAFLARARSDPSLAGPWNEYIRQLPRAFPTPLHWDEDKGLILLGTPLYPAVLAKRNALSMTCPEDISIEDWTWADTCYTSRVLDIPNLGPALVPLLDFANHALPPTAYWEVGEEGQVLLIAGSDIPPGSPVCIDYGMRPTGEWLFLHGFVPPHRPPPSAILPIPWVEDQEKDFIALKRSVCEAAGWRPVVTITEADVTDPVSEECWAVLAIASLTEEELELRSVHAPEGDAEEALYLFDQRITDPSEALAILHAHDAVVTPRVREMMEEVCLGQLDLLEPPVFGHDGPSSDPHDIDPTLVIVNAYKEEMRGMFARHTLSEDAPSHLSPPLLST